MAVDIIEEIVQGEETVTPQEEVIAMPPTPPVTEVATPSTSTDYWNIVHPSAIAHNRPDLAFDLSTDVKGELGFNDEDFQAVYANADTATKKEMLGANNKSHALKIAEGRAVYKQSAEATAQDGVLTQLGMGIVPALASPTTLIPMGGVFKAAQIAKTTNRLTSGLALAGAGAVVGAGVNVMEEGLFDLQGRPTNYLGAAGVGAIFGGGLGFLGGALSGPQQKSIANAIAPENDTFTKDYTRDPSILIEYDENGIIKLQDIGQMDKSIIDKIPFIGDALRSDVHTVYQADSSLLRGFMGRLADATVALKDSMGNLVVTKQTAHNLKRTVKGHHNKVVASLEQDYALARQGGFEGSIDDFGNESWKVLVKEMNNQKYELSDYIDQRLTGRQLDGLDEAGSRQLLKDTREITKEFYDNYKYKFDDSALGRSAKAHTEYYQTMLKQGQALGTKGLKDIHHNRLYVPRTYNFKGIQRGDVSQDIVQAEVRAGIENDVRNGRMSKEEVDIAVEEVTRMLNESVFDLNNLTTTLMFDDLPFESRLKGKKLSLNESFMPSILNSNLNDLTGAYHYQLAGRIGIQYAFGTDKLSGVMELVKKEHLDKGILYAEKEIEAFRRVVEDILGTLRMNKLANEAAWTFTRNLTSYNTTRLGAGFGGIQFIELASSIAMQGTKALFSGRLLKSLRANKDLLFGSKGTNDEFANYIVQSGYMESALHTSRVNRYADTESGFNSGWLENKLNWMNDKLMKYNGMRYFLGVMEDYTGGAIVSQLKAGNVNAKRLARWGLSPEDATVLGTKLKEVTKNDGWDLASLSRIEADQLQLAITKGIEEIVVQGDSIHLPPWLKAPGPFTKVLTQFMRFPLIAQETLLRRGMTDEQAQMVAGTIASIFTYVGIKYLREQASVHLGMVAPIDMKYDLEKFDDEDWLRVTGEALNYTAPLGFMTSVWNYGAVAVGEPELGREWQSANGMSSLLGPSGGLGEDLIQLMRAGYEGELTTERNFKRFRSLVPFMNLPLLKEGTDVIIEEYGD
jgi:hypothetical protein